VVAVIELRASVLGNVLELGVSPVGIVLHTPLGGHEVEVLSLLAVRVQQQRGAGQDGPEQQRREQHDQADPAGPAGS
jgi:hypothetical protein